MREYKRIILTIFFNHSQCGGNYGAKNWYYLKTMYMGFQRELLWTSGFAEEYFIHSHSNLS